MSALERMTNDLRAAISAARSDVTYIRRQVTKAQEKQAAAEKTRAELTEMLDLLTGVSDLRAARYKPPPTGGAMGPSEDQKNATMNAPLDNTHLEQGPPLEAEAARDPVFMLAVKVFAGTDIKEAERDALSIAKQLGIAVTFDFNGFQAMVTPRTHPGDLTARYLRRMEEGARKREGGQ